MTLVAPAAPAGIVVDTGPASADALLPWDGPGLAPLLGGAAADPATEAAIAACEAAIALSRSSDLRSALEARVHRVLAQDPIPRPDGGQHAAQWAVEAAAPLLSGAAAELPDLEPGPAAERGAEPLRGALPKGFLALHPGSGSPRKNWPAERFVALSRHLSPGSPWLLVGGRADTAALEALAGAPGAVLAHNQPPRILAAVLRRAGVYVGNDSGVSHLAAAAGVPTLALFGPTRADVWRPLGRRVDVLEAPSGRLEALAVGLVVERARQLQGRFRNDDRHSRCCHKLKMNLDEP